MNKRKVIIIAIIIAVLAAVIATITFFVSNASDQQIDGSFFIAKYKGDGSHKVTITVKGDLPEGSYWHVQNLDNYVAAVKMKKEKKNAYVVTLDAVNQGQTQVAVFADNYEQSIDRLNVQNNTMVSSNGNNELQADEYAEIGSDYDASLVVNLTINCDEEKKFDVEEFYMGETFASLPLMENMPYPAYMGYDDEQALIMIMNDADDGWSVKCSDSKIVKVKGPVINENGIEETKFNGLEEGEAKIQVRNEKLETGFEFTILSKELSSDDETKEYILSVSDASILNEPIVPEQHEENITQVKEISEDVGLPEDAKVESCEKYSYNHKKDKFEKGGEIARCAVYYRKCSYRYTVAKRATAEKIKKEYNLKPKGKDVEEIREEVGEKKIIGYKYKDADEKESIIVSWEDNNLYYILATNEANMDDVKSFISESKPIELKESSDDETDAEEDNKSDEDLVQVEGGVIYKGTFIKNDSMWLLDEMKELENGQE